MGKRQNQKHQQSRTRRKPESTEEKLRKNSSRIGTGLIVSNTERESRGRALGFVIFADNDSHLYRRIGIRINELKADNTAVAV